MKTIKFLLIAILLASFIPTFAQKENSTMDKLQATVWWDGPLPKWVSYMKFSKTKWMITTKYEGKLGTKTGHPNEYYLSDMIDTVFDVSKVGKIQNGKYIIENGAIIEIVKLDNTNFWYKVLYPEVNVGSDYIFKWSAVSDKGIPWKEE